jgi:hypothetical protein
MNNPEAKFILGAYRPHGQDAGDPVFAEPLAQAGRDPELRRWLERQRQFDGAIAGKLRAIAPPPGLREAILAGARASQPRRRWFARPGWLLAAAAIAVMATLVTRMTIFRAGPDGATLAALALRDLAEAHGEHVGHPPALAAVQAELANARLPLAGHVALDLDALQKLACRRVSLAGRPLFEICFEREGTWYHVYVGRRADFAPGNIDPRTTFASQGQFAATAWADADHVYALVTGAGAEALRRVI